MSSILAHFYIIIKSLLIVSSADSLCKQYGYRSGLKTIEPDLDPNCLTLSDGIPEKNCWKKLILKKNLQATKNHEKLLSIQLE